MISLIIFFVLALAIIVYHCVCEQVIANKTETKNGWMAWVPLLNGYLLIKIANRPGWWFLLFFIPIVNIIIALILFMDIAELLNKPRWLGVLALIPVVNIWFMGYLAFPKLHFIGILLLFFYIPLCFYMNYTYKEYINPRGDIFSLNFSDSLGSQSKNNPPKKNGCNIQGIICSKDNTFTLINGNIYYVNDSACGGKIVEISKDAVWVQFGKIKKAYKIK